MCVVDAALIQYLEAEGQPLLFHTWTYFIWVTITTVGYGDITPKTMLGRFALMGIIGFAVVQVCEIVVYVCVCVVCVCAFSCLNVGVCV